MLTEEAIPGPGSRAKLDKLSLVFSCSLVFMSMRHTFVIQYGHLSLAVLAQLTAMNFVHSAVLALNVSVVSVSTAFGLP